MNFRKQHTYIFLYFNLQLFCRYWAVTDIDYAHQRTAKRIGIMILILWVLSFLVSVAPMFGWKGEYLNNI